MSTYVLIRVKRGEQIIKPFWLRSEIVYDFVISCMFSLTLFLSRQIIQSSLVLSSPEVVRSQVFTRLRALKQPSIVQVVDGKVKPINKACRTAG